MSPPVGAGPPYSLQALSTEAISTTFATGSWSQSAPNANLYLQLGHYNLLLRA